MKFSHPDNDPQGTACPQPRGHGKKTDLDLPLVPLLLILPISLLVELVFLLDILHSASPVVVGIPLLAGVE